MMTDTHLVTQEARLDDAPCAFEITWRTCACGDVTHGGTCATVARSQQPLDAFAA